MNQNNKNEYEIIDSHNSTYRFNTHTDCTKYPFTNNPNQPLQNMNYKDWITMDQHNQYYSGGPIPFETDIGTAVSAGIIVAGTMLAAVSAPFAIIAVGGAIVGAIIISIGTLLPIFWPNGEKDKTVWTEFIKMGENYVDTPLTETVKEDKLATLEGIRLVLAEYEKGFQDWKDLKEKQIPGSKPSQALQQASLTVKTRFEIVNNDILREMPGFQLPTYKMILLPIYAQVANLHLTLLQQGIEFADIWNADIFPSQTEFETNAGTSNDYYKDLIKKIQEYSNYCANTYREGLNNLKNEATMTWGILNSYRKEMTLTVLDIIAMFPFFDPKKYRVLIGTKNAVIGTKSELTREIYMDTHLEDKYERYFQLDKTEEVLIRKPHLFTWLSGINFETLIVNPSIPSLIGHQVDDVKTPTLLNPIETNSYDLWDHCIKVEGRCSETKSEKINFLYPTNIFKLTLDVYAKGSDDPTSATTLTINKIYFCDQNESIPPYIYNAGNTSKHIEKRNAVLENHYLSCITSYYPLKTSTFNNSTMQTIDMEEMKRYTLVWTHDSADPDNKIYKDTTTSLPVVKAYEINLPSKVIEGPGHTGGDVIQLQPQGSFKMTCRTASAEQKYFIRIRYASNGWVTAKPMINLIITQVESLVMQLNQTFAHTNYQELQYQEFGYLEFPNEVTLPANETINLIFNRLDSFSDSAVIIDKVEFLPITSSLQESREREKIEFAQMKVSSFFTNHTKNILQADVTDYEIDQTATLIESLTEEVYPQEKLMLLHEIKHAKQLSQSRNLLQNGDFTSLLGWTTSKDITIQTGNSDFKGYSLHMTGARTTGLSSSIFPTYIYQKIQEVTLKPYTRYRIRGFVKQSKNMEIFISRYEQEHHVTLDVENHLGSINPYVQSNIGETQAIPFNNINNRISGDFQESLCKENIASFVQDSHTFSYTLDTGELDLSETPGMELMFQISNPDGFAILGNLEVIEERLLTSEEIQQIHEKENRWKKRKQEQQKEVETSYSQAQQAITQLFANTQFSMLKWETTLQDITMANHLLDRIPNVYHRWLPDKPGSNHSLFIQLKDHISKAYVLYYSRNTIQNGDFSAGFKYWSASRDAKINETDDKSILFIPSWSTQVSQQLHVKPNSQYLLRVRGKKEGKGNGYIKISDVGNHVETLTFPSSDNHTNQMYNESEGFITKTLSIRPYTDQLRIDIGETEGTFMIESIELLHIKV